MVYSVTNRTVKMNRILMSRIFRTSRRINFADTDMAGITHFTNYFRYMEEAEHEFLRSVGLSVVLTDDRGQYGFPKLSAECRYRRPMQYEQTVDIELVVDGSDRKTIRYDCTFRDGDELVAEGKIVVACCRFLPGQLPYPIPLPDSVYQVLCDGSALSA